ncbi:MAG: PorP/SprF family type IX secretion system membrane protein [Flavobacteriales bacterium]
MLRLYVLTIYLAAGFLAWSQDIHWTQFNQNPIYLNVAHTGNFAEDLRLTANYRTQWRSVSIPFQTTAIAADTKWKTYGVGLNFFHDQVGDGKFQTLELQGNVARSLQINKVQQLRVGLQFGFNYRQLNSNAFYFDSQFNGYIFDPNAPTNENFQTAAMIRPMLGLGTIHQYRINHSLQLEHGLGLYNLTRPNQSFFLDNTKRDLRFNYFATLHYDYYAKLALQPSLQLNLQGSYRSFTIGSMAHYLFSDAKQIQLSAGLWWRIQDAFCLDFGFKRGPMYAGISYDFNYSSLVPASRGRGAFELSFRYVFIRFKPPQKQYRVCPDFI